MLKKPSKPLDFGELSRAAVSHCPPTTTLQSPNPNPFPSTIYHLLSTLLVITITNSQSLIPVDTKRLRKAVRMILQDESISRAKINVAVVDDPTIAALHQRYLNNPDPTDVLSFQLERSPHYLEGEVVISAETAKATASHYQWSPQDELLLYAIHGLLHLLGYDDTTPNKRAKIREQERKYLARFGLDYKI